MDSSPLPIPPPPLITDRADDLTVAFFVLLEGLSPEARAAVLLHCGFDARYAELANALGLSEAACRDLVNEAKTQLRWHRPR